MVLQCRLCLRDEEAEFTSIFDSPISLVMIIWNFCHLMVEKNDGLPDTICSFCKQKLESFSVFKLTCKKSDEILRNKLSDLNKEQENLNKEENINPAVNKPINKRRSKAYNKLKKQVLAKLKQWRESNALLNPPNVDSEENKPHPEEQEHKESQNCNVTENTTAEQNIVKSFICEICSQEFSDELSLKDHQEVHTTKMFRCDYCEREFINNDILKFHKLTHKKDTGDKSAEESTLKDEVTCNICNETFESKACLTEHINLKHKRINTGPFKCKTCSKLFKNERELEIHNVDSHMNEEEEDEHKCVVCSRVFRQYYSLKRHMTSHPGAKTFKCKICSKSFMYKSVYKSHMLVHSVDKPYRCDICLKAFVCKKCRKTIDFQGQCVHRANPSLGL
ncbi:uncharacterized protein LOC143917660 [Arctopsyche grandis]|uniref:uncharacterized protein LOC143917660 n=1 Tax=Arctopsyche grandis TaxID=121162 RepID=UPI00406D7E5F